MKGSKPIKRESLRRIIAGIRTSKTKTVALGGTQYKLSDLARMCQKCIDAGVAADAKYTAWRETLAISRAKDATLDPILQAFIGYLLSTSSPSELTTYGMKPRSRVRSTLKTKAGAADKAAATRLARNTLGKRQKTKVVGAMKPEKSESQGTPSNGAETTAATPTPSSPSKTSPQTN